MSLESSVPVLIDTHNYQKAQEKIVGKTLMLISSPMMYSYPGLNVKIVSVHATIGAIRINLENGAYYAGKEFLVSVV